MIVSEKSDIWLEFRRTRSDLLAAANLGACGFTHGHLNLAAKEVPEAEPERRSVGLLLVVAILSALGALPDLLLSLVDQAAGLAHIRHDRDPATFWNLVHKLPEIIYRFDVKKHKQKQNWSKRIWWVNSVTTRLFESLNILNLYTLNFLML